VPWLTYWLAVSSLPFDPDGSMKLFERAFLEFEKGNDRTGQLLAWSGAIDSAHLVAFQSFRRVSSSIMDPWIAWLEEYLQNGGDFPSEMVEAHVSTSMTGALLVRRPQDPQVRQWSRHALALARALADEQLVSRALGCSIGFSNIVGDYSETLTLFEQMDRAVRGKTGVFDIGNELNRAILHNQSMTGADLALASVRKGLEMAEDTGTYIWVPMLLAQGALACFNRGERGEAGKYIDGMKDYLKGAPILVACHYYQMSALRSVLNGDIPSSIRYCQQQLDLALDIECPWITAASRLHMAIVLTEADEVRRAREELEAFRMLPDFSPILNYTCLLTKSTLEFKEGNEKTGVQCLKEALALARTKGYVNMFYWWDPAFMTRLYTVALKYQIETQYVHAIIKARDLFPEKPPLDTPDWPWPFKVYTLGTFNLLKHNSPITFEGRGHQRPLTLLKAILALGGRQVPEYTLTEWLWPDATGDAAHSAYTTTLSRLRRVLGNEKAIEVQGGRVSLNPRYFWIDAWLFEDLWKKINALKKKGDREGLVQQMEEAVDLYRGQFLSYEEEYWIISARESLQSRFLNLVQILGEQFEDAGDLVKATQLYEKALQTDDLVEEFYRCLMRCYERQGRHAEAVNTFHRCRKALQAKLGVNPSVNTQHLYETLKGKQ
jgi:LuxR family transcriptional regulator, maltose regulon positive regulatory protein